MDRTYVALREVMQSVFFVPARSTSAVVIHSGPMPVILQKERRMFVESDEI